MHQMEASSVNETADMPCNSQILSMILFPQQKAKTGKMVKNQNAGDSLKKERKKCLIIFLQWMS